MQWIVFLIAVLAAPAMAEDGGELAVALEARRRFQEAGGLLAAGRTDAAIQALEAAAGDLPLPYSDIARNSRQRIAAGNAPLDVCLSMHAHAAAVPLLEQAVAAGNPRPDLVEVAERKLAYALAEAGRFAELAARYRSLDGKTRLSAYREYYRQQADLVLTRQQQPADAAATVRYVEQHILGEIDATPDYLAAIEELWRALPDAPAESHASLLILTCLERLGDGVTAAAWEERILAKDTADAEACGFVLTTRGGRLAAAGDIQAALDSYGRVLRDYPASSCIGAARFNTGVLLARRGDLRAAIAELEQLLPADSGVNDLDSTPDLMAMAMNYRHQAATEISHCYRRLGDHRQAREYKRRARDDYPYQTFCGTGAQSSDERMGEEIASLEELAVWIPVTGSRLRAIGVWCGLLGVFVLGVCVYLRRRRRPAS